MLNLEVKEHLNSAIIPFWQSLKDNEYGGYYGQVDFDLSVDPTATKGCIINSRILRFFSTAYLNNGGEILLDDAEHAYNFLINNFIDEEYGGVYWSLKHDGTVEDNSKHLYNQVFAIYALASYYEASNDEVALAKAMDLYEIVEEKSADGESFDRQFNVLPNEKLSENGVMAAKSMNTLLHIIEAYTELYRVSDNSDVKTALAHYLDLIVYKSFSPEKNRLEVFFDENWNSLIDLNSYGHNIEASWLIDYACDVLEDYAHEEDLRTVSKKLVLNTYESAYQDGVVFNECENGNDDKTRIWWVHAEAVVGFLNAYQRDNSKTEYLEAALTIWDYIKTYFIDPRANSEWHSELDENNTVQEIPVVDLWKGPYHNGRMCLEVLTRNV